MEVERTSEIVLRVVLERAGPAQFRYFDEAPPEIYVKAEHKR